MALTWFNIGGVVAKSYVCSYCSHLVGPSQGWNTRENRNINGATIPDGHIYVCSFCNKPTFFDVRQVQYPGPPFGNAVGSLPHGVQALYKEARDCMTVNAHTAAVLVCRKLLMHLAAEKGAPPNQSFLQYVQYLADQGYVPPNGRGWVDHIRQKGNEANHEITVMSQADAKDLIIFSEMLLKFVYEFPAKVQPPPAPAASPASSVP